MLFKNKNVLGYAKLNMLEGSKKVLRWSIFLFIILGYFFFFKRYSGLCNPYTFIDSQL